jgi:hypothetical protein
MEKTIKYEDLWYTVSYRWDGISDNISFVEIEVFKWIGAGGNEKDDEVWYQLRGADEPTFTNSLDEAERSVVGNRKWDAGAHLTFYPDNEGYNLFGDVRDIKRLLEVLEMAYKECGKILSKSWNKEFFGLE